MSGKNKVLLCILDGFGLGDPAYQYNAVFQAKAPNIRRILATYPNSLLQTSGLSVGLPEGQMGNSEVGHMTIGSGRVVYQDLPKITKSIESGELFEKPEIFRTISYLKNNKKTLHLIGLCSDGGVHSHVDHIIEVANYFAKNECKVALHAISDGRDVAPNSFLDKLDALTATLHQNVQFATISGRFYAMDRDNRTERTTEYMGAILKRDGVSVVDSAANYVRNCYDDNITDEFIKPAVLSEYCGAQDGDVAFMANFRSDRARQLTQAMIDANIFERVITMTNYSDTISRNKMVSVLFEKEEILNTLSDVVSCAGLRQLRIAETEKYAHVTFFFNGGKEIALAGEDRILIQSPQVQTYDLKPEMSLPELQVELIKAMKSGDYDFIVTNIANGDMVGHTGNFDAAKRAVEAIDSFLGDLESQILGNDYTLLITADHGNLEEMIDIKTGQIHTQHTTGPVPFVVISNKKYIVSGGGLRDIAPTILEILDLKKPSEMTGISLLNLIS